METKQIDYAYIAGFIDGDGRLLGQLVKRPENKYQFEIRITINFYQKTLRH